MFNPEKTINKILGKRKVRQNNKKVRQNNPDNIIHKVEDQWHYDIMKNHGFVPITKEAKGLVRQYKYKKDNHIIMGATGYNSDYWVDENTKARGYWGTLEEHVKSLK